MLATAVAAVLLVCCVNLANLLLARGVARQREVAVRQALGVGRARLIGSLMMESALLALRGGAAGIVLAEGALWVIRDLASSTVPFIGEATIDATGIAFTLMTALFTALIFGLLPAWRQASAESCRRPAHGRPLDGRSAGASLAARLAHRVVAPLEFCSLQSPSTVYECTSPSF